MSFTSFLVSYLVSRTMTNAWQAPNKDWLIEHLLIYSVALSPFRRNNVCKLREGRNKNENKMMLTQSEKDWLAALTE